MNIITQGISIITCCVVGSVAAGFSLNCSHMVTPSRMASTPRCRKPGGSKGRRPNRLMGVSGSGADKSFTQATNG